ncbi:MAG: hypothetical protein M1818_000118 [Claussenomyces sp. TS43310]|nr:MAG: hypothetical protein M1818_000118 [Claussenomyces sp. TS43310]
MEGFLLVPPERGTIIGRAAWKPRYIVLGSALRLQQTQDSMPRSTSSNRLQAARKGLISAPSKPLIDELGRTARDQLWLSIYKQKGDWEAVSQYQITAIRTAEIQEVQHRKPAPALPTLVLSLDRDPAAEKTRKRRSSRASSLSSSNPPPSSLLFRTVPDDHYNIYDWQLALEPLIKSKEDFEYPISPTSPLFNTFINPFAPRASTSERPSNMRPELHHRGSSKTYASTQSAFDPHQHQTSTLVSPSPSLRSRRSDLSSQASSMNRSLGYHTSFPIQHPPPDLPSPASTAGYDEQLISGWTSAQGRSSALSTHTRGSNSVSVAGTPPPPRETILDRAFQMRVIPGSDRAEEDGKEISSIARFEALMREIDERTKKGKRASTTASSLSARAKDSDAGEAKATNFEADRERADRDRSKRILEKGRQEDEEKEKKEGTDEDDDDYDDPMALSIHEMPTPAQRALEYISGRITPLPRRPQSPVVPPVPAIDSSHLRQGRKARHLSMALPSASSSVEADHRPSTSTSPKRQSSTSAKRLSFTEFTKRLSSTSSLLLVQTNASSSSSASRHSGGSSEASYVYEDDVSGGLHRGLSHSGTSALASSTVMRGGAGNERDTHGDRKCSWRGSGLGVFGSGEGNFL